jgi:hypothetical protein
MVNQETKLFIILLVLIFILGCTPKTDNTESIYFREYPELDTREVLLRIEKKIDKLAEETDWINKMAWGYIATYQDSGD